MSESSWPFDSGSVTETTWSRMARVWGGTGIVGYAAGTSAQVYGDSSGMQVKIRAGQAQVRGHHWYSDAEVTKSIGANSSGNPRIDRIVLRLDPSANTLALAVLAGTPGSSPAAPALTQTDSGTYELSLAQVYVANGASTISAGNVADERLFIADRGSPTGSVQMFAGASAPAGWLIADGAAVSRTSYSQLFALLGTTYGVGDGSTTFNLPNLKGKVPVGYDATQGEFDGLGEAGGAKTRTLTTTELPAHAHVVPSHSHTASTGIAAVPAEMSTSSDGGTGYQAVQKGTNNGDSGYTIRGSEHTHSVTVNAQGAFWSESTGSGGAFGIIQPYLTLNFIIKT